MNAVGYIRVSTPEQAEGESPGIQTTAIQKYIKDHGWKEIKIYSDVGRSGATNDRPALIDLLEGVQRKEFETVVIYDLDRFGRDTRDLLNNMEILKNNGVKLVSIQDHIEYSDKSDESGELHFGILSVFAQREHKLIKRRLKQGKMVKWRDGRTYVGRLPFGYFPNKEDKTRIKIEVNQKERELYLRIVSMYLDRGKSFSDIVLQLGKEGFKCRRKPWSSASLSYVLKNPVYWGHYVVNQTKYNGKKRTKEKKPASEHIPVKIDPPFFITKTKWDQIQKRTQFNKSKGKHITISEDYFLRDILVCGECKGKIKPKPGNKRKDGTQPRYYGCYWSGTSEKDLKASGRKRCTLPYIKAEEIEEEVWYYLTSFLTLQKIERKGTPTPFHGLFDSKKYEQKLTQLKEQLVELENEIKKKKGHDREQLYDLLAKDKIHTDEFLQRLTKNDEDVFTLTSKIEDCRKDIDNVKEMKDNDLRYKEFSKDSKGVIKRLIHDLQNLSPQDKKQLVDNMLKEKIKIWKGRERKEISWEAETPKLRFNKDILQRFMEEEKIPYLNKATPNHPSRYEL